MLILILINVQYLHIVIFSFEKGLNDQKHSFSDSNQPMKQPLTPQQNFSFLALQHPPLTIISDFLIPPLAVTQFEKPWTIFKSGGST